MYKGFRVSGNDIIDLCDLIHPSNDYYKQVLVTQQKDIKKSLDEYLMPNGSLSATKISNDWFPSTNANVFISHSHDDIDIVQDFANLLCAYDLRPFVDSTIWGYADYLIDRINNKYSVMQDNGDGSKTYYYNKCNYTSSHVNLMLNAALLKMINKCECIIFIDSPKSLSVSDKSFGQTESPWIYSELLNASLIEKKGRIKKELKHFAIDEAVQFPRITYDVNLNFLYDLNEKNLVTLFCSGKKGDDLLDLLYDA